MLRDEMRPAHDFVDTQFSTLDLKKHTDFMRFLTIHEACFTQICAAQTTPHIYLRDIIDNLRADMRDLQVHRLTLPSFGRDLDPTAIAYIVEGSRMGTAVLRRRWAQSHDQRVLDANAYFDATYHKTGWRVLCGQLERIKPGSKHAQAITSDATTIFSHFSKAFHATETTKVSLSA
jgi:heme oxygenase